VRVARHSTERQRSSVDPNWHPCHGNWHHNRTNLSDPAPPETVPRATRTRWPPHQSPLQCLCEWEEATCEVMRRERSIEHSRMPRLPTGSVSVASSPLPPTHRTDCGAAHGETAAPRSAVTSLWANPASGRHETASRAPVPHPVRQAAQPPQLVPADRRPGAEWSTSAGDAPSSVPYN